MATLPGEIPIKKFPFYIACNAKNPTIYNKAYFHDFMDTEKLENFPDSSTYADYKINDDDSLNVFKVAIFFDNIDSSRTTEQKIITFNFNQVYTGKQIIYKVLKACFDLIEEWQTKIRDYDVRFTKTHALKVILDHFITELKHFTKNLNKYMPMDFVGSFMYVYTDVIAQRHVGDEYHRVLNVLPINEVAPEYTIIKNVQYYPVNKKEINSISILLTDEKSNLIPLEGGYNPTCVTLHFKKDII
jgi:hypothetical protein